MDEKEIRMHHLAGMLYGENATCGTELKPKVKYGTQESAERAAIAMSDKYGRDLEAYPCVWCNDWHIGRTLTEEERDRFTCVGG